MKQCPQCHQTYSDENLNFCLNDGEMLTTYYAAPEPRGYADDSPPTVMLNPPRNTDPTNWPQTPPSAPPAQWQGQQPTYAPQAQFGQFPVTAVPNQTLAIVSLCLGVASLTIGWCCYLGLLLSPAAIITGYIAMSQNTKDPARYGGRGLAIGGMATGAVFIGLFLLVVLIYGLAIFGSMLGGH